MSEVRGYRLSRGRSVALVALLAALFAAGGAVWVREQARAIREARLADLAAIGQLKAAQIAGWRARRLGDANLLMKNAHLGEVAARWLAVQGSEDADELRETFTSLCESYGYDEILLVDLGGAVRLGASGRAAERHGAAAELAVALRENRAVLTELHTDEIAPDPHLSVVAPLSAPPGPTRAPVAAAILVANARRFLYPLIQSWPVPSASAETLLVRRDGDEVLFLNDLRFHATAALALRIPLGQVVTPAVQAVLGREGPFEGTDYRGVPVVADLRAVPGSDWWIVAKVDRAELLAGLRRQTAAALLAVVGLILLAALGTGFLYETQRQGLFRGLYKAERERRLALEELRTTLHSIGDAVIATDARGLVRMMNVVAERLTGWAEAETVGRPLAEVFRIVDEATRARVEDPAARVLREGAIVGLANHTVLIARDGGEHPIADSGAPIRDEEGAVTGVVLVFRDQTAERTAQREMALLTDTIRASLDEIYIFDAATLTFRFVNDGALRNLGYSLTEIRRLTPLDLKPELTAESFQAMLEPLRRGDIPLAVFRTVHRRAGGSRYPVEVHLQLFHHLADRVFLAIVQDITEREKAEESLRRLNRALHTISECNQALVRATDEDRLLHDICRLLVEVGGYRMAWVGVAEADAACTVRPVARAGHDDGYLDAAAITWADAERGRGPTGTAIRERRPMVARDLETDPAYAPWRDEALRRGFASSIALPLLVDDTRCLGALSIYADGTDAFDRAEVRLLSELADDVAYGIRAISDRAARDQAEVALRHSEAVLQAISDGAPVMICVVDDGRRILTGNRAFVAASGWPDTELGSDRAAGAFGCVFSLDDSRGCGFGPRCTSCPLRLAIEDTLASGTPHSDVECQTVLRRHGLVANATLLASTTPVRIEGRQRVVLCLVDITERRDLEAQLRQAQKMEALGTLAGGIAHDFNNLLQALLSSTQAARLVARDPALDRALAESQTLVTRGAALTRQLLLFSRQSPVVRERLDVADLITENASLLRRLLPETVDFAVRTPGTPLPVEGDAGQLGQVLTNLVVNARDAMPGGGRLAITAARRDADVVVEVADTGVGIAAELRERIFDPFFTTKAQGKGTGLGLAVVWGIVKEHGGRVEVASQPGEGATFRVVLPASEAPAAEVTAAPADVPLPGGHGELILLVEDEEGARRGLTDLLAALGYAVTAAESGEEALSLPARPGFDLLLTDYLLPGASGAAVADAALARWPGIRIVVMSGYAPDDLSRELFAAGTVHFLQKPFDMVTLAQALRAALAPPPAAST